MKFLLVRQEVADFEQWYSVFSSHTEAQRQAGLNNLQLLRDASDPNIIVCLFEVDDIDSARAFTQSPSASEAKVQSGVVGQPEVFWLDEV